MNALTSAGATAGEAMKSNAQAWSLDVVFKRRKKINPKPQYQRTDVWNTSKKQLLIDSILRGYDLPKFYLRPTQPPFDFEVVDGQQRLHSIWEFLEDRFELPDESGDLPFGDCTGKRYSE